MTEVFEEVAVSKIEGHADNPRLVLREVEQLAASIRANGLTSTPAVMRHPKSKVKFVLLCGHRRLAALKQLRTKSVLVRVYPSDLSPLQQMQIIMDDNTEADALTVTEEARGVQTMIELDGFDFAAYAKAKKLTQKAIKEQASLASAPPAVRVKLDAYQMSDQDYFAIRDFEDDQEVFAELVDVAGTNNFEYRIRQARRLRDLPVNMAVSQAAINESGCKEIAYEHRHYSSSWAVYKPADGVQPMSPAEHGAAKHRYYLNDNDGLLTWYVPIPKPAKAVEDEPDSTPEQSEEEAAAEARLEQLQAGLNIAAELLHEHIKTVVTAGDPVMAQKAGVASFVRRLNRYSTLESKDIAWVFNIPNTSSVEGVEAELVKLDSNQLSILMLAVDLLSEYDHKQLQIWNIDSHWFERSEKVRAILRDVLGYEQISIEEEALQHFADLATKDAAHRCQDCGEWQEEPPGEEKYCALCLTEYCSACSEYLDGDGYDGKCADCADTSQADGADTSLADVEVAQ